jgi:uncharacterized protein with HEPN domain
MSNSSRNIQILEKIIQYCDEIEETKKLFGNSKEALSGSFVYRNAAAMCVLQIGELSNHLTTEFKQAYADIPWREIIGMRNIAAHHYGTFRTDYLWETISSDTLPLKVYCEKCLTEQDR